jgi:aminomethyltransferase
MTDTNSALLQETPLRQLHESLGAKMVPFAGWRMPVLYSGITAEHRAVRETSGVFDISHMGQFFVSGANAAHWLNSLLTNNVERLAIGEGQYSLMLNDVGGVIDDLILYRETSDRFFLVVNASMIPEDAAWMRGHLEDGVLFEDDSNSYAGLAVQGPDSQKIAAALLGRTSLDELPPRNGIAVFEAEGQRGYVCRTGYTGEDGFEWFCPAKNGTDWFQTCLDAGATPCGLGARDTLRLEMGYPLNGSDLSPNRTPLEAGLGFFVDLEKPEFIGHETLREQKATGLPSRLYALKMIDKGPPPRAHYPVWLAEEQLGETCSGGVSPSLSAGIAMAYLTTGKIKVGSRVDVEIRGKRFGAEIVRKPFYTRPNS